MRLALSSKARRAVEDIRDAVVSGKYQRAVTLACDMLGERHVPEIKGPVTRRPVSAPVPTAPRVVVPSEERPILAQPKRRRRLVDDQQRKQFKQDHPQCATPGPDCKGPITYSHLTKRSACGPDANYNALPQCLFHHEIYERHPQLWWDQFRLRLNPLDYDKVILAHPEFADDDAEHLA